MDNVASDNRPYVSDLPTPHARVMGSGSGFATYAPFAVRIELFVKEAMIEGSSLLFEITPSLTLILCAGVARLANEITRHGWSIGTRRSAFLNLGGRNLNRLGGTISQGDRSLKRPFDKLLIIRR